MSTSIIDTPNWQLSAGGGFSKQTNPFAPSCESQERDFVSKKEMVRRAAADHPELLHSPSRLGEKVKERFGVEVGRIYLSQLLHSIREELNLPASKASMPKASTATKGKDMTFDDLKFVRDLSRRRGGYLKLQELIKDAHEVQSRFGSLKTAQEVVDFLAEDH